MSRERWSQKMFKDYVIPGSTAGSCDIRNYSARWEDASHPILASGPNGL